MRYFLGISAIVISLFFISCETVVNYELPINATKIVVEGSIENGHPPLVILSKSFPFFGNVNFNNLDELLIKNAVINVSDGNRTVTLMEYNKQALVDLSEGDFNLIYPTLEQIIAPSLEQFGDIEITQDTIRKYLLFLPNFTFYTVAPSDIDFIGEVNRAYGLAINLIDDATFGTRALSAVTTIPGLVNMDSLWVEDHPNSEIDTLFQLRTRFRDPDTLGNFYRYFTRVNGGAWLTASASVFDDGFINGESIPFSVTKGQTERAKLEDPDFDVDGYWAPGDTAEVKICNITEDHYQFWRTVENEKSNNGSPFGSFTILASNIQGEDAVGIWGGYASTILTLVITEP
ncbi:MAG: DUF4249 family protein [Chitinophagales bacterium]